MVSSEIDELTITRARKKKKGNKLDSKNKWPPLLPSFGDHCNSCNGHPYCQVLVTIATCGFVMTNIRSVPNKNKPYFQIKKSVLQDINISLEAKGLYAVLMSFEDEKIETDTICQVLKLSKSRLFELLTELGMEVE